MSTLPPSDPSIYDNQKRGYFGRLGRGANAEIRYIQSGISYAELDRITLIENIPGSERWHVRDLFQRDVDKLRVTHDLLPYLQDATKVKYFNPLTLALLPLAEDGRSIRRALPIATTSTEEEGDHAYKIFEFPSFFRFRAHTNTPAFSLVEWNGNNVRVVAIDGQHRLSALKRWKNDPQGPGELREWIVPVVLLGIFRSSPEESVASLLEIVRKTFVYINTQAETINEARKILLNDESVNDICVQEFVQESHSNDCKPLAERVESKIPLLFFDWRGETRHKIRQMTPAAILKIEELKNWFESYILGPDGDPDQAANLNLDDMVPPLQTFGEDKQLNHEDARRVRAQFLATAYAGIAFVLENFAPYDEYIQALRDLERQAVDKSDVAQHAFSKLRFGTHRASEDLVDDVTAEYSNLLLDIERLKNDTFPELLTRDIGPRAIMAAFGTLKNLYDDALRETVSWEAYAEWYVAGLNRVHTAGWFDAYQKLDDDQQKYMTHIVFDRSGGIVNYKVGDVKGAFGTLLALLVVESADRPEHLLDEVWDYFRDDMMKPLKNGFRKEIRAKLRDTFKGTQKEFRRKVNDDASQKTEHRLNELGVYLGLDVD